MDVETDDYDLQAEEKGTHNSALAVGIKTDRSFVSRGSRIGVFKHEDDHLKYSVTINDVKDLGGSVFSPRKLYLHDSDTSMLLLNPDSNGSIFRMDVPTGKGTQNLLTNAFGNELFGSGGRVETTRSHIHCLRHRT